MMDDYGEVGPLRSTLRSRQTTPRSGPRRRGREGSGPRGTRPNASRSGHRAGTARPARSSVYGKAARANSKQRFTALLHHVYNVERLHAAYLGLKRDAAAGVDGETWAHYGEDSGGQSPGPVVTRVQRGAYRAQPVRRAYIPKTDGRQRPLGVPALEDKIVQRALVEVLNAVYDTDFLGFSYGFRPQRSPHLALDALTVGIMTKPSELGARRGHSWLLRHVES